jgi:uncharacterized surface protein with fasciclin (FAS1) repeats
MLLRLTTAAAVAALLAGAAQAQTAPAQTQSGAATGAAVQAGQNTPARGAAATTASPANGAAASATASASAPAASGDLVATAQAAGEFGTLLKAAEATGLVPVLKGAGPLTVFAPTDAAFAALPAGELDRLMQPANRAELQKLLLAHVVNTSVPSSKLAGSKGEVTNGAGGKLSVDGTNGVMVNNAKVVRADIPATNGIIHVVDKVIMPAGAAPAATSTPKPSAAAETSTLASTDTVEPVEAAEAAAQASATQTAGAAAPAASDAAATADAASTEAAPAAAANSNGPVADTPENRAKYPPQSRAGQRSAARGN